jgi:hypothetical protein
MADDQLTPPDTPNETDKGQAAVHNHGITNNRGVVTGNNYGYNIISGIFSLLVSFLVSRLIGPGTINITVEAAADLTNTIQSFTDRVATASERIKSVGRQINDTSNVLLNIKFLIVRHAKKEGITISSDGNGKASNEGEKNATEDDRNEEENESAVLKMRCFKNLMEASEGTTALFKRINEKIRQATDMVLPSPPPDNQTSEQPEQTAVDLTEEMKEQIFLKEHDIDIMENDIVSHKLEVQLTFTVFQAVL